MKHCKVEVYLLEFKLSLHSNQNKVVTRQFSRADTVGKMRLEILILDWQHSVLVIYSRAGRAGQGNLFS